MNFNNNFALRLKGKRKNKNTKIFFCTFFLLLFVFNVFFFNDNLFQDNSIGNEFLTQDDNNFDITDIGLAAGPEIFIDPFKVNFTKKWNFFKFKYESELDMDVETYYRKGDNLGVVTYDKVYSIDNLLLYKTLLKDDTDAFDSFDTYLKLRDSLLWYQNSVDQNEYGFVRSVDNTTDEIFDDTRYLIDNIMPIFLLIDNVGTEINSFSINSIYPKDSIEEAFLLINSSQFRDDTHEGFYDHNSTTDKYAVSNMYAMLAALEVRRIYDELNLDNTIKNSAYEIANMTIDILLSELWDNTDGGFEYYGKNDWSSEPGSTYKYLKTNALGIITLLEYWIDSGMQNDSTYLKNATLLFNKMDALWDSGESAYEQFRDSNWVGIPLANATYIDLEANSIMMSACLKLFEYTGNLTYYDRAWDLYNTFESSFYDTSVNSYKKSIDPVDNGKDLYANLRLCEAYLEAYDIYNDTQLNSMYNVSTQFPDYIFNQDTLNITSVYSYTKTDKYYNISTLQYEEFTVEHKIDDASISYILKTPDQVIFDTISQPITDTSSTLLYSITDALELGTRYYIQIFANCSNFGISHTLKQFNVISGLVNSSILGLPQTLYQGPIVNITIPINNTRSEDINLTVSMEGLDIIPDYQNITFITNVLTNVTFNLTTIFDAAIGPHNISFKFKEGDITYLIIKKSIIIGHSFDYSSFMYETDIVNGESAFVSMILTNFLPNNTQVFNISYYQDDSAIYQEEIFLFEKEIKAMYFVLNYTFFSEEDRYNITMVISKGETDFYTKQFYVDIIPKYEILSVTFPEIVEQGVVAQFILTIQNNQDKSEAFALYVNGERVTTNLNGFGPGINRVVFEVLPSINPYEFGKKYYIFELRDGSNNPIARYYYEIQLELSSFNLIVFYILPVLIPVCIALIYKNKEIKHKLLRR
ncbi:MAG: hypothetical protein KGD70_01055 [Candidatus Lokiarchaeota archaeon]|nr:hypothetical protein [Candidatus Lokiarchaeota archaeon]